MKRAWTLSVLFTALPVFASATPWSAGYVSDTFPAAIQAGARQTVTVTFRNEGTQRWDGSTRLGMSNPRDRESSFYTAGNWIAPHRVRAVDTATAPGAHGTFTFDVTAPVAPGHCLEDFEMLQELVTWFEGTGDNFRWRVTISAGGTLHIEAEDFDNGGPGVAYHVHTPGNPDGTYRNDDVAIEAGADGGYSIVSLEADEWLRYSNIRGSGGLYSITARVASEGSGGAFHLEINGGNVTGTVSVPDTGGGQTWTTLDAGTCMVGGGANTIRLVSTGTGFNLDWIRFTPATATPPPTPDPVSEIIVDNPQAVFTGAWNTASSAAGKYGDDYRWASSGSAATATYNANVEVAGNYRVSVWYPAGSNRASNAPHAIHHAGGVSIVQVNQQTHGGQWNVLGIFHFETDGGTVVILAAGANNSVVMADAVRFEYFGTGNPDYWGLDPRHTADPAPYFARRSDAGDRTELAMRIGTAEDRYQTVRIPSGHGAGGALPAVGIGDSLLVRFVVPDDLEGHQYHVAVRIADTLVHERSGRTRGFGPRSLYVPLGETARALTEGADGTTSNIRIENLSSQPLHLESVTLLSDFASWVGRPMPEDDFLLSFLTTEFLDPAGPWYVDLTPIGQLNSASPIRKALSLEIHYPNRWASLMRTTAQQLAAICNSMNLDFLPILASWWMGTPSRPGHPFNVRDNIELQQICWSDTDDFDEANFEGYLGDLGRDLKTLLGDRWDLRYGLTIPNMWSDNPWPTLNHAGLNAWRHTELQEAVGIYEEHLADRIVAYVAENEPAYWTWPQNNPTYPVQRNPLWADFNPHTVADALADGVHLDPSNGLDLLERAWFHLNLARYNENTIAAIRAVQPARRVYSHVLLGYDYYPFQGTGRARPHADPGRVANGRLGVEMLWGTDMDSLWRLREWGRWGCVNREELDSWGMQFHLATLRANYALGSDMLNSYNWHIMRDHIEGNPVVYFNTFIDEVAAGARLTLATRTAGSTWLAVHNRQETLPANAAFPWFNRIELQLQAGGGVQTPLEVKLTRQSDGAIVAHRLIHPSEVQSGLAPYDFGDLAWLAQGDQVTLRFQGATGWQALGHGTQGVNFRLVCDMNQERHRSHYVIGRRDEAVASTVPVSLPSAGVDKWNLF